MKLAKPVGRLIVATAIYLTACSCPPVAAMLAGSFLTEETIKLVMEAIASVTAGNVANAIEKVLPEGNDHVSLENEDLIRVAGRAIAGVIAIVAQEQGNQKICQHLKKVADKTPENWVNIVRSELAQHKDDELAPHKYAELMEGQLPLIITPTETGLTQATSLTETEWRNIFTRLDLKAVDSGQGVDVPSSVRQRIAELLHTTFPKALRQALKEDFKKDGKAFAGFTIQLLTGISAELNKLQESQKQNFQLVFEDFQRIETQLLGTEAQQQAFFREVGQQINSGFAEVCARLNITEQTITELLEGLKKPIIETHRNTEEILDILDPKGKLCRVLLEFNYVNQVCLFDNFLESDHKFGACLIHGSPESEHLWLRYRLIDKFPAKYASIDDNIIKLTNVHTTSFSDLLKSTYKKLNNSKHEIRLNTTDLIREINETILDKWQTKTIILTFKFEQFASEDINNFVREFWIPLADLAARRKSKKNDHRLLVFFIDSPESQRDTSIYGADSISQNWTPKTLLKLEEIKPLSPPQLQRWLGCCLKKAEKTEEEIRMIIENILNENRIYTHQDFFKKMCKLIVDDITWEDLQKELETRGNIEWREQRKKSTRY